MASAGLMTPDSIKEKSNRYHMVTWVNNLLKTNFKDVQHLGSGDFISMSKTSAFLLSNCCIHTHGTVPNHSAGLILIMEGC